MQEDYPTFSMYFLQMYMYMYGSLLLFFHLCLVSLHFSGPSLLEVKSSYIYSTDQMQGIRRKRFDCILNAFSAADELVYR